MRSVDQILSRPIRTIPHTFSYKAPRTQSWLTSFHISGQSLLNNLSIISYSIDRESEFKSWLFKIFLHNEIDEWRFQSTLLSYHPIASIDSLPHSQTTLNYSLFTFTDHHLLTPGFHFTLPFITSRNIYPQLTPPTITLTTSFPSAKSFPSFHYHHTHLSSNKNVIIM